MNAVAWHRIGQFFLKYRIPLIPRIIFGLTYLIFHCVLPPSTKVGQGTKFGYGGLGVVCHGRAIIGANTLIAQYVTIGGRSGIYKVPIIGDNVFVGAGAAILGPICIGDNAVIGANAVVLTDVEEGTTVVGVPAHAIRAKR